MIDGYDDDPDDCSRCAGDCFCGAADGGLTDEELRQLRRGRERDEERARELFRAAGRPLPRWLATVRGGAGS